MPPELDASTTKTTLIFVQDILDWTDPTEDGSCAELAESGRILFDLSRTAVSEGGNPTASTTALIQSYVPAIASILDEKSIVDKVSSCAVVGSSSVSCDSLSDRLLNTCNEYKTLVVLVPDRVCNGQTDITTLYTEAPPYSCDEIQAMRNFTESGGRIVFLVDNDPATASSNVEVNRILDALGSTVDITMNSVSNTASTISPSAASITGATGVLCGNTGTILATSGVDDIVASTFNNAGNDPSVIGGNVDRDALDVVCTERLCS